MNQRFSLKWLSIGIYLSGATLLFRAHDGLCSGEESFDTIVIVEMRGCCREDAYPEAEQALSDELRLLHIPVIRIPGIQTEESAQHTELEQIAKSYHAAAAVRLKRTRSKGPADVRLWITDLITQKTVYRRIEIDRSKELSHSMLVAMRTVETLRASLLELHTQDERPEKPVSAELQNMVDKPNPLPFFRFGFGLSSGLTMSPGGAGIRAAFAASGTIQPMRRLDICASANWSPVGGTYNAAGVRSSFTYLQLRGWIYYRFRSRSLLRPAIGLGAGAFLGKAFGETENGTPLKIARTRVPYVGMSARVYIFPSERIPFYVDGSAGILLPEAQIVHGDTRAAAFGYPLIELSAGIEWRFMKM